MCHNQSEVQIDFIWEAEVGLVDSCVVPVHCMCAFAYTEAIVYTVHVHCTCACTFDLFHFVHVLYVYLFRCTVIACICFVPSVCGVVCLVCVVWCA